MAIGGKSNYIMSEQLQPLGPLQEQWMQSLEQHPERQMSDSLGYRDRNEEGYEACCLGEAGIVAGVCRWGKNGKLYAGKSNEKSYLSGVYTTMGLYSKEGSRKDRVGDAKESLADLNDNHMTWPEIAALIRSDPSMYFSEPK